MSGKELIEKAKAFAEKVHAGQTRKNKAKTPAITHMAEVAALVAVAGGSPEEIAAAWLHDTVEDSKPNITIQQIKAEFGEEIANIVDGLTDLPEFKRIPLLRRKMLQAWRVQSEDCSVQLVKIADQISNVRSIVHDPPVKWNREKCIAYAAGAMLIVHQCARASTPLYFKFQDVYSDVIALYL